MAITLTNLIATMLLTPNLTNSLPPNQLSLIHPPAKPPIILATRTRQVTEKMNFPGNTKEIILELYDETWLPFIIYFPSEYLVSNGNCAGDICNLKFTWKMPDGRLDRDVFLNFLIPKSALTVSQAMEKYVTGKNSLFAENPDWKMGNISDGPFLYPWMKKSVSFTEGNDAIGTLIIGEYEGQTVIITEFYRQDSGDLFRPIIRRMYDSLDFAK